MERKRVGLFSFKIKKNMLRGYDSSAWFAIRESLYEEFENHFKLGGTVEDLNEINNTALENALYEDKTDKLKFITCLIKHGAKMRDESWIRLFNWSNGEFFVNFLVESYGFLPTKNTCIKYEKSKCMIPIIRHLCKKTTLFVLLYASVNEYWIRPIWSIIAKMIWKTRRDLIWINCLT